MKISVLLHPSIKLDLNVHAGIERVALSEAEYLAAQGHSVDIYAASVIGRRKGVHQIPDLGWKNRLLQIFYYLTFGLLSCRSGILHGHYTPILALFYPKRAIIHFHGLAVAELILYRFKWARERYNRASYVFVSRWILQEFKAKYDQIPASQLHLLYNGIDIEEIKPVLKEKTGILNICFYGRWVEKKGIYQVLEAAEILEKKGRKDFKIWYGGSAGLALGKEDLLIDRKVREMTSGLQTVELVGEISRNALPSLLGNMDLGLMPSIFREPMGLVALEMMAAGLPVISYDYGGPRETIVDGKTGYLVESKRPDLLAEKIEWFLDNRQALAEMGKNARRHVEENFSLDKHGQGLMKIYHQIIESN